MKAFTALDALIKKSAPPAALLLRTGRAHLPLAYIATSQPCPAPWCRCTDIFLAAAHPSPFLPDDFSEHRRASILMIIIHNNNHDNNNNIAYAEMEAQRFPKGRRTV